MTDSLVFTAKTEKRHIAYVSFLFEAYDGIGIVRTADPEQGILEILVAPDFEADFRRISDELGAEIAFSLVEPPQSTGPVPGPSSIPQVS